MLKKIGRKNINWVNHHGKLGNGNQMDMFLVHPPCICHGAFMDIGSFLPVYNIIEKDNEETTQSLGSKQAYYWT